MCGLVYALLSYGWHCRCRVCYASEPCTFARYSLGVSGLLAHRCIALWGACTYLNCLC